MQWYVSFLIHLARSLRAFAMIFVLVAAAACSTVQTPSTADPYESMNRSVFTFNDALDRAIVKPVAKGYQAALPSPVRGCITNFFSNVGDVFIGINNLLQGKVKDAGGDFCRVALNSTVGILGLFDVATDLGLPKHNEDFGQTFGRWGADAGPYLVLPVFGPSSVRDGAGFVMDSLTNPLRQVDDTAVRNSLVGTRIVDQRSELLSTTDTVDSLALDRYSFVRDAYLARRRSLVFDGNPPPQPVENFDDEANSSDDVSKK